MQGNREVTVVKSNKLIEASYKLTLDEQRLILSCIGQVDSKADMSKIDRFKVTAKEFSNYSGVDIKSSYQQLENAAQELYERSVTFYDQDTNDILVTRWVSSVKYNSERGDVELCFANDIVPLISQIQSHFTKYKIENIANLTSIHSIRIYELCLQYLTIGHRVVSVDELKYYLGIENQYEQFKDLNKRVLKSAVDQINKYTDIKIKMDPIRENRKIISLKFEIESKQTRSQKVSKQKSEKEIRDLANKLNSLDQAKNLKPDKEKLKKPSFKLH